MRLVYAYITGIIFGVGISISGMANPAKVVNFFDIFGVWDPSLAFVMGGALVTTMIGYRLVLKRPAPIADDLFHLPTRRDIDTQLLAGSAVFGVGWGIAGFCPGAALPALGTGMLPVIIFVAALIVGILLAQALKRALDMRPNQFKAS